MSKEYFNKKGISSFTVRMIAIVSMLWSFASASKLPGISNKAVSDCLFWFSYTLFAFLLAQGIKHTSDRILYIRRMAIFTLIAEPCYDFYNYKTFFSIKGQSIMLTLFISFIIMMICDYLNRRFKNVVINIIAILALTILGIRFTGYLNCQFANQGILICMLFYTSLNLTYDKLFQIILMLYYAYMVNTEVAITFSVARFQLSLPITIFAIFALFITWVYNDERGPNSLALKIIFYTIYPLSLLLFGLIKFL